jgi:hypothetical protein
MTSSICTSRSRLLLAALALAASGAASAQEMNYLELERLTDQFQAQSMLDRLDVQVRAKRLGLSTSVDNAFGTGFELMRFDGDRPVYYATHNRYARQTIKTDLVILGAGGTAMHLNGENVTVGNWDKYHPYDHQDFGQKMTRMDTFVGTSDHATHNVGTMIEYSYGMAYMARCKAYTYTNDLAEMATAAAGGMQVSNHSYGPEAGWALGTFAVGQTGYYWFGNPNISTTEDPTFGTYTDLSRQWDQLLNSAVNYLPFKSAGNDRLYEPPSQPVGWFWNGSAWVPNTVVRPADGEAGNGYDTLDPIAVAKNVMVVGAVAPTFVNDVVVDATMSTFSAWGPTDDGRIKPDICADGVNVWSATGSNGHQSMSGTSMASASAAASAGLLADYAFQLKGYKIRSSTLRGLIIHTADDKEAPGPDYRYGWGVMNTRRAADLLEQWILDPSLIRQAVLPNAGQLQYTCTSDGTRPLRASITWIDPAGVPGGTQVDNPARKLVNDLDIRITRNGNTYYPWAMNPSIPSNPAGKGDNIRDNVEVVDIPNPAAGTYVITIRHKGTLVNSSQPVSVIISGVSNSMPKMQSMSITPAQVKGGSPAQATVTLTGPAPAGGALIRPSVIGSGPNGGESTGPLTVLIPAGQTSVTFPVNTKRTRGSFTTYVFARYNESAVEGTFIVRPPHVINLTVTPNPQTGGLTATGTVTVDVSSPPGGGMFVELTSSNPAAATVPEVIWLTPGATQATFDIACQSVGAPASTTIKAAYETSQRSVVLQVNP